MAKRDRLGSYSIFSYWSDGSSQHEVNPDPPAKGEARPFHVAIFGPRYIPISALVFARDEAHAAERVRAALRKVAESSFGGLSADRARDVRTRMDSGEYTLTVEPFDTDRIACHVNWASNGGL